jgi:hypothetical protein
MAIGRTGSRGVALLLGAALLAAFASGARAEDAEGVSVPESVEVAPKAWTFSLTAFGYGGADEPAYGYATFTADRDRLHLEARYGYEDRHTASLWAGMNFEVGDALKLSATPMVGGVFGDTQGVAAGYELTLAWKRFELYTEGEYLYDLDVESDSYFYSWSELSFSPCERWRVGLVAQRTKAYQTDLDIQRGFLVGLTLDSVELTAYVLNLGFDTPIFALSISFEF